MWCGSHLSVIISDICDQVVDVTTFHLSISLTVWELDSTSWLQMPGKTEFPTTWLRNEKKKKEETVIILTPLKECLELPGVQWKNRIPKGSITFMNTTWNQFYPIELWEMFKVKIKVCKWSQVHSTQVHLETLLQIL